MRTVFRCLVVVQLIFAGLVSVEAADRVVIPAATAYLEANQTDDAPGGEQVKVKPVLGRSRVRVTDDGITGFGDPQVCAAWYGKFSKVGRLTPIVTFAVPAADATKLLLRSGGQNVTCDVAEGATEAELPEIAIKRVGNHAFRLSCDSPVRLSVNDLVLSGTAVDGCHFNNKPRRNAASVHLRYPQSQDQEVATFYCEMTAIDDPVWSYYMACGWHRGYFGMQVNSETERRIIFSVWDSGNEGVDRDKVAAADRVQLVEKGDGVYTGDFGNEGTGGHSHLKLMWETGKRQKFVVTAKPVDATHTIYSGYYFRHDVDEWMLIASWKAPREGGYMKGLYSFSENFAGQNGQLRRKALYGSQWVRTADKSWIELTKSSFSHDVTGRADRFDRFMGVESGDFFLAHGFVGPEGITDGLTDYGAAFTRPAIGSPPEFDLPN